MANGKSQSVTVEQVLRWVREKSNSIVKRQLKKSYRMVVARG